MINKFPFGPATKLAPAHAAVHSITIENMLTLIALTALAANTEIDLTPGSELEPGAQVIIDVTQGAVARNVALGDNIVAPDLAGVIDDRDTITLTWNGVAFVGGAWAKVIDAA